MLAHSWTRANSIVRYDWMCAVVSVIVVVVVVCILKLCSFINCAIKLLNWAHENTIKRLYEKMELILMHTNANTEKNVYTWWKSQSEWKSELLIGIECFRCQISSDKELVLWIISHCFYARECISHFHLQQEQVGNWSFSKMPNHFCNDQQKLVSFIINSTRYWPM